MNKKIVLITGATDGIGKQTAIDLIEIGFHVIIHGRNYESAEKAYQEIKRITKSANLEFVSADLSSLKQVRLLAEEVSSRFEKIDVLINNAGIYMNTKRHSEDGFEMTFAVNHLSHFLLTNLILEKIRQSNQGRIINVSSIAHQNAKLDWDNLNAEKSFSAYGTYSLSKLANVIFSNGLAERLKGTNVTSNSLHPGVITTKLLKAGFNMTGASVKKGAETSVFLASSEKVSSISGEYFIECKTAKPNSIANDNFTIKRFWNLSAEMTGLE